MDNLKLVSPNENHEKEALELNDYLFNFGGHIGYSIRPSERKKGYATLMLQKALEKCKTNFNLEKVLITCDKDNLGSAKVIQKNGGILENEIEFPESKKIKQRYWVIIPNN